MNHYNNYDIVNKKETKQQLKKDLLELMNKDNSFQKVHVKFNTVVFTHDQKTYTINFTHRQKYDGVVSLWRLTDFRPVKNGVSYRKVMVTDDINPYTNNFTAKDTLAILKDLVEKY